MVLDVTISQHQPNRATELVEVASMENKDLLLISHLVRTVEGDWLDRATDLARREMISDVDIEVRQAREVIKSAREKFKKAYPVKYRVNRYILNPIRSIWLLMSK